MIVIDGSLYRGMWKPSVLWGSVSVCSVLIWNYRLCTNPNDSVLILSCVLLSLEWIAYTQGVIGSIYCLGTLHRWLNYEVGPAPHWHFTVIDISSVAFGGKRWRFVSEDEWMVCYLFKPCYSNVFQCYVHTIDSIELKAVAGRFSQIKSF